MLNKIKLDLSKYIQFIAYIIFEIFFIKIKNKSSNQTNKQANNYI